MATRPTIAIVYGFAEGPWHGRALRRDLEAAGFVVTGQPDDADLVIAHSGGCFLLTRLTDRQAVVLVNPAYWPGRSFGRSFASKTVGDVLKLTKNGRGGYLIAKTAMNVVYLITKPLEVTRIVKATKRHDFGPIHSKDRVIIVRSAKDAWCTPDIGSFVGSAASLFTIPRRHDDLWWDTEPIVNVVRDLDQA